MIVSVVGEVDSGKTTFVNNFLKKKITQSYGRTEDIKEYKGSISQAKVSFLDCPGHDLLSYNNHFALCASDMIILLVDATRVNINVKLLQTILKLKKPLIVIFNKFERKYNTRESCCSLKEILLKKEESNRDFQKDMYDLCSQIPCLNLKPFTQLQYEKYEGNYAYFLSLKTKWGLNEFINFFKKTLCKVVLPKRRAFLYKINDRNNYNLINPLELTKNFFKGKDNKVLDFKDFLNYNAKTETYNFKDKYNHIEKERVYIVEEQINSDFGSSEVNFHMFLEEIKKELENISSQDLFETLDTRIGKIFFHIEDSMKIDLLKNIFEKKKIECVFLKDISLKQFMDLKEEGFKIAISNKSKIIDLKKKVIVLDSLFEVDKLLKVQFQQILSKEEQEDIRKLSQITLIQLDPNYIYKESPKEIVIGLRVHQGTLKKKMVFNSLDLDHVEVLQLQKNKKQIYAHSDPQEYVAAKLKLQAPLKLQRSKWFFCSLYKEMVAKESKSKIQIQKLKEIEELLKS